MMTRRTALAQLLFGTKLTAALRGGTLQSHGGQPGDVRQLIRKAQAVAREQFELAARYLGQEDIRVFDVKQNGRKTLRSWSTYEASILEGSPYYRLVARNGKPLTKRMQAEQDRRMALETEYRRKTPPSERRSTARYSTNLQHLLDYHDLTNEGENKMDGRRVWVIGSRLKADAPAPAKYEDLLLAADSTHWIDQETGAVLRWRLVIKRPMHSWSIGAVNEKITLTLADAAGKPIFVPKQMSALVREEEGMVRQTVQSFSNYKRFEADSLITFDPK